MTEGISGEGITLACSTLFFKDKPLIEALIGISQTGISLIEIMWESGHGKSPLWENSASELVRVLERLGLRVNSIHAPYTVSSEGHDSNRQRQAWQSAVTEAVTAAAQVGADYIVLHPNVFGEIVPDPFRLTALRKSIGIYRNICEEAMRIGVRVAIENVASKPVRRPGFFIDEIMQILDAVGTENAGICFDISHSVANGHDPVGELGRLDSRTLYALHCSDNRFELKRDCHLIPGEGNIDWQALIDRLHEMGFRGPMVLELTREEKAPDAIHRAADFLSAFPSILPIRRM